VVNAPTDTVEDTPVNENSTLPIIVGAPTDEVIA